jgi:hypothetical protein
VVAAVFIGTQLRHVPPTGRAAATTPPAEHSAAS